MEHGGQRLLVLDDPDPPRLPVQVHVRHSLTDLLEGREAGVGRLDQPPRTAEYHGQEREGELPVEEVYLVPRGRILALLADVAHLEVDQGGPLLDDVQAGVPPQLELGDVP